MIPTRISANNAPPIPINYRLRLKTQSWMVYDIVDRQCQPDHQLPQSVRHGDPSRGIDGLITALAEKNQNNQAGAAQPDLAGCRGMAVAGALDFTSVPLVWPALARLMRTRGVSLSLADVDRANSAGMVMLVEARDLARQTGCQLVIVDIPSEFIDLAQYVAMRTADRRQR